MSIRDVQYVVVQPQIELCVRTIRPPASTNAGHFAKYIDTIAGEAGYVETPDGWLVPLQDLWGRAKDVADFIYCEALQYGGELEIGGGIAIRGDDEQILAISLGSNFRFAMELARTIINLDPATEE